MKYNPLSMRKVAHNFDKTLAMIEHDCLATILQLSITS